MADDSKKQFSRWRKTLEPRTAFLVDQVLEQLLPPLFALGYEWAATTREFGALADCRPGEIPLQRRSGAAWPTTVISFNRRGRSCLRIDFTELPEVCHQLTEHGLVEIPRHQARVFNGPCHLIVVRGERLSNDGEFGCCPWPNLTDLHRVDRLLRLRFAPEGLLRQEVRFARECMSEILEFSVSGLPREWETISLGRVGRHMYLLSSHHWARVYHRDSSTTKRRDEPEALAKGELQEEDEEDDDFEHSAPDIAADPALSSIDADVHAVSRRARLLRNLMLAGATAAGVCYLSLPTRLEPVRVLMVSLLLGAFPAQFLYWGVATRRVGARHGLVCPHCGEPPPSSEVMRTAIKLRCSRCGGNIGRPSL